MDQSSQMSRSSCRSDWLTEKDLVVGGVLWSRSILPSLSLLVMFYFHYHSQRIPANVCFLIIDSKLLLCTFEQKNYMQIVY